MDSIIENIRRYAKNNNVYIAFSGGEDSVLTTILAIEALSKSQVYLVHVHFGPYTYSRTLENVKAFASSMGLDLTVVNGRCEQEKVLRYGPACNLCTRRVKLGLVKKVSKGLILTGANSYDSWGKMGIPYNDGVFSPLFYLDKDQIRALLMYLGVTVKRVGESSYREGCKAKHLLKMLVNPEYHGEAVAVSNEILLAAISRCDLHVKLANVKIIGPLSRNVALVNVVPSLPNEVKKEVVERISALHVVDEVRVVERPLKLKIMANPGLYNDPESRKMVERCRLAREFAVPIYVQWMKSSNRKLRTFQVVEAHEIE